MEQINWCALPNAGNGFANFGFCSFRDCTVNIITNTNLHTCCKYAGHSTTNTLFYSFKYRSLHDGPICLQHDTSDVIFNLTTCDFATRCSEVGRNKFIALYDNIRILEVDR